MVAGRPRRWGERRLEVAWVWRSREPTGWWEVQLRVDAWVWRLRKSMSVVLTTYDKEAKEEKEAKGWWEVGRVATIRG